MNGSKLYYLLAAGAFVLALAVAVTAVGGLLLDFGSLSTRIGLMVVGLVLADAAVWLLRRRSDHQRRNVERQLEALCGLDPRDVRSDSTRAQLPTLPPGNPWAKIVEQVRETLLEQSRRVEESEHARAALDIRHRRATAERERIGAILSGLNEPVLAVDDYNEVVLANESAQRLFQFDLESADSRALAQLTHCEKLVSLLSAAARRKNPGERTDEIEVADEHGEPHWYRATAGKLTAETKDAHGADAEHDSWISHGAVAVLRDIGDQKALQKRNAEFVSAVSHEMKTPLAGIKAYVELLVDGDAEDEETQEEFLDVINGQADRLQRLVDNMLNLARIEAGVVNVSKQTRSLNELLEEAIGVVQPSAEAKQIVLTAELSPMYLGVLADRDMLLQSAINLLSNAVKYTPEKGKVTLRSRMEDNRIRFEVEDTGVGLSEEDCQRVFEKFYRVKKDKNMAAGTGLGLPLAKHIVEDVHGGQLVAASTLGRGSTFAVTLPSAGQLT